MELLLILLVCWIFYKFPATRLLLLPFALPLLLPAVAVVGVCHGLKPYWYAARCVGQIVRKRLQRVLP